MADSTPIQPLKTSFAPSPVARGGDESSSGRLGPLPAELRNLPNALKIAGEVVQSNRDGTVRVHTDRGDFDIRLNRDQPVPERGQKVEVEIQAGQPPERANIRPVREQPPEQVPPRPSQTPVNVEVGVKPTMPDVKIQPPPTLPAEQPPRTMPEVGQTVQIKPVTVREVAALLAAAEPEVIINVITQIADFKAQIIATQVVDAMAAETLNVQADIVIPPVQTSVESPPLANAPPAQADLTLPPFAATPGPETPSVPASGILPPANQISSLESLAPFLSIEEPAQILGALTQILQPGLTTGLSSALPPITQPLNVRIESIAEPGAVLAFPEDDKMTQAEKLQANNPAAILQEEAKPGLMTAIITGSTPESLPILSVFLPGAATLQNFIMQVPVDSVIPGTQIQLMPQPGTTAQVIESALVPSLSGMMAPGSWPVMSELYQTLAQISPQAAQAMAALTPSPANPTQMNPAALFFIAAVRGGDISGWLGDKAIDALRRDGRTGLLSRITQEGGILNRMASEPLSNDWRGMNLPMLWQNEMHKIALYYKNDRSPDDQDGQKAQTRFIFDLNMTQMGKVQLDGLFRGGRLDLIVRTEDVFSQSMQMDMRRTYATALKNANLAGELSFQNKPEQWVTIKPENKHRMGVSA